MKGKIILVCLIVIALAGFYFYAKNNENKRAQELALTEQRQQEAIALTKQEPTRPTCYVYKQGVDEQAPNGFIETISLEIIGDSVIGKKKGLQFGENMLSGYSGQLSGTKNGEKLDVLFKYEIDGSSGTEKEIYTFINGALQKLRYQLVEQGDMLVPNTTGEPTVYAYEQVPCENSEFSVLEALE